MTDSAVARRCRDRLRALRDQGFEVPRPFDAEELCRRVGRSLPRPIPITVVDIEMPGGAPYGLTFFTDDELIIACERRTTPVHRDQIIAHEVAHIVFGHESLVPGDQAAVGSLLPALRPSLVRRVLGRTGIYGRLAEAEAETLATMLLEDATRPERHEDDLCLEPADARLYQRLRHAFEHPDR